MRTTLLLALAATLAVPVSAQQSARDPDIRAAGGGTRPAGWSARLDRATSSLDDVKFERMGAGLHVTTGPAVILWREADLARGGFHTEATFTQTKAPTHPEAYGLFVAGKDLKGEGQAYTYFLIRGDGKFLVKQRTGATTANVTQGWTDHAAVVKQGADGKATNKLEILVGNGKVTFSVNGKEVHSMSAGAGTMAGIVGLRINHNLDVHIDGFGVHAM